jgi:Flp pilus assembly protein TadD
MISPHLEQLRQLLQAGQWSLAENLFHQLRRTGYQIPPDLWNEYGIALARNGRMQDAEIALPTIVATLSRLWPGLQ